MTATSRTKAQSTCTRQRMNNHTLSNNTFHETNEILLTETEAAEYIRMSRSFLSKDRMNGYRHGRTHGPHFVVTGRRCIRYRKDDLDEWIMKNRVVRVLPK